MTAPAETPDQLFRACVHCGLCLENCPTYVHLGNEADSPRGRIWLMHALAQGRIEHTAAVQRHLDLCLGCRGCETACPSGVRYGALLERHRAAHPPAHPPGWARLFDYVIFRVFPDRARLRRWARVGRTARRFGLDRLLAILVRARLLPTWVAQMQRLLPPRSIQVEPLRPHYPAAPCPTTPAPNRAWLFAGCAAEALFPATNRAAVSVMNAVGVDVATDPAEVCCGAIHLHAGRRDDACRQARANIIAFAGDDPIVTPVAGCGAMLRQYGELLHDDPEFSRRAAAFSARVRDVSEFVAALLPAGAARRPLPGAPLRVAYHDPCHLCHALRVRLPPRQLLRAVPGVEIVEIDDGEMCCGAAGTYNLVHPDLARRLAESKLARIDATGAAVVAAGNAGCLLHLAAVSRETGRRLEFVHPIDLLAGAMFTKRRVNAAAK